MKYTRDELISIAYDAVMPYEQWCERDTPDAQIGAATVGALLRAGCKYKVLSQGSRVVVTDGHTIWLEILHYEFESEERWETYYLPTRESLEKTPGRDWY